MKKHILLLLFVAVSVCSFAQKVTTYSKSTGNVKFECYQGGELPNNYLITLGVPTVRQFFKGIAIVKANAKPELVTNVDIVGVNGSAITFAYESIIDNTKNRSTYTLQELGFSTVPEFIANFNGCINVGGSGGGAVTSVNGQTGAVVIPTGANLALGTGTATSQPITNSNGTGVTLTGATTGTAGLLIGTDKAKLDLITVTSAVNLNNLLLGNTAITGATKTKITYDSKGLVTAGADATATDIINTPSGTIAATTVQAAITELNNEKVNLSDYNSKGDILTGSATAGQPAATAIGANGQVLMADNTTVSGVKWATPAAGSTAMVGATAIAAGTAGIVPQPIAGQQNNYLRGDGTWAAASSIQQYASGDAIITATGAGVTFTRTTASVWTFDVPAGVILQSFQIYNTAGNNPGVNVTLNFNYASNTLTNQNLLTAYPPLLEIWNMQSVAQTVSTTGGAATSAFRPAIASASGGNISTVSQLGSAAGALETMIRGVF